MKKGLALAGERKFAEALQCMDEAIITCDEALAMRPNSHLAFALWETQGDALAKLGKKKEAIECYRASVEMGNASAAGKIKRIQEDGS